MRLPLILTAAYFIQLELVEQLYVLGVAPNILWALVIAVGLIKKDSIFQHIKPSALKVQNLGLYAGFMLGLGYDLYLPTVFGLSAVIYALTGHLTGLVTANIVNDSRVAAVLVGAGTTALGIFIFVVAGEILNQDFLWGPNLWKIVLVQSLFNGPLTLLGLRLIRQRQP